MAADTIDPELRHFLDEMRKEWAKFPPFGTLSFPEQRRVAELARARWRTGGPQMARTINARFTAANLPGDLKIRVHIPELDGRPLPAMIYLHGGGFTLFSIETHDRLMREYAAHGGFAVIGVDYPLAPENKFPIALDLLEAFTQGLAEQAAQWGVDANAIALAGDSAGANLSLAICMRLRDRGNLGPVKAVLSNYGGFTPDISDDAEAKFGGAGSIMDRAEANQYWANYLRDADDHTNPYACPAVADLAGLPPVLLVVPDQDIVSEQSYAMHDRLMAAGVRVDQKIYAGAIHSFLEAMSVSSLARQAIADGADFVAQHLKGGARTSAM